MVPGGRRSSFCCSSCQARRDCEAFGSEWGDAAVYLGQVEVFKLTIFRELRAGFSAERNEVEETAVRLPQAESRTRRKGSPRRSLTGHPGLELRLLMFTAGVQAPAPPVSSSESCTVLQGDWFWPFFPLGRAENCSGFSCGIRRCLVGAVRNHASHLSQGCEDRALSSN